MPEFLSNARILWFSDVKKLKESRVQMFVVYMCLGRASFKIDMLEVLPTTVQSTKKIVYICTSSSRKGRQANFECWWL